MKQILFIFMLSLAASPLFSQNLVGNWNGIIDLNGNQIPIVFHFYKDSDGNDVTGAGDTFGAALTWGLGAQTHFDEALAFAVMAASRSVTQHGPRGGKASKDEVLRWRNAR